MNVSDWMKFVYFFLTLQSQWSIESRYMIFTIVLMQASDNKLSILLIKTKQIRYVNIICLD